MSRALQAITNIVQNTFLQNTSEKISMDTLNVANKNIESATLELNELRDIYLKDNNRSGVLKCELMKITLNETSDLMRSTVKISDRQISIGEQSKMFLSVLQDKLTNMVIPNSTDSPETKKLKEFMYESQLMYSEKTSEMQNEIESRINDIISRNINGLEFMSPASKLFDCSMESGRVFISKVHPPEVRFGNVAYTEPQQSRKMGQDMIHPSELGRIRDEFNAYAKSKGWDSMGLDHEV